MFRRVFAAVFRHKPLESANNVSAFLARVVEQSRLTTGGAHLLCAKCRYDLHGLPGDTRCPVHE